MARQGLLASLCALALAAAAAQGSPPAPQDQDNVPVVYPGHPDLDASVFQPFTAEYLQTGVIMRVEATKTEGEKPVYSVLMIMPHPQYGAGTDHIGHYAADLGFAFRRFGFRDSYLHVESRDGELYFSRTPLPPDEGPRQFVRKKLAQPFVDGTLAYWLLAGLPLKAGYAARLANWRPGPDGPELRNTPPFRVVGKETVQSTDGEKYECWVVEAKGSQFTLRNYVTRTAPYLIQQVMVTGDGEQETVVQLARLISR